MNYDNTREAYRDALEMKRWSVLAPDEDDLPEEKRTDYLERMAEAADMRRKEMREESL